MPPTLTATKKEKILIMERDAAFGQRLSKALQDEGYAVSVAKDGPEGLKMLFDQLPHLVIIGITLTGIDGYEVLEKKQAEPLLAKIPVFLLSMQGEPIDMRRVPAGSVSEFIAGIHSDPALIVEKVNRAFGYESAVMAAAASIAEIASKNTKAILWVEDDKLIGSVLGKKLASSGFYLFLAKNGQEALDHLKDSVPDGIVLDLLLPGMSGFDILQSIKKNDGDLARVPVMILSNLSKQSDVERAKVLGAQKFIVKAAVSLDQIVAEVRDLCK
jgi:CheY-like chemotaxis protein